MEEGAVQRACSSVLGNGWTVLHLGRWYCWTSVFRKCFFWFSVFVASWDNRFFPVHTDSHQCPWRPSIHTRQMNGQGCAEVCGQGSGENWCVYICSLSLNELYELELDSVKSMLSDRAPQSLSLKHHLCTNAERRCLYTTSCTLDWTWSSFSEFVRVYLLTVNQKIELTMWLSQGIKASIQCEWRKKR